MMQRLLYTILTRGLALFSTNPEIYDRVFGDYLFLGDKELASIRAYFAKNQVRVQHGYAHADIKPPLVNIMMQGESQTQQFLGTLGHVPMGLGGQQGTGSVWENSYQLNCYTENIDATSYLYEVVKAILLCSHGVMAEAGIMSPTYSGMDLAPDRGYVPENLFVRVLTVRASVSYVLPELLADTPLFRMLSGLHVAPGTERDPGSYAAGVYPESTPPGT